MNGIRKSSALSSRVMILSTVCLIVFSGCTSHQSIPAATPEALRQAGPFQGTPTATSETLPASTAGPIVIENFQDLRTVLMEIRQASPAEAQSRVDELWASLVHSERVPLVLGTQVIFLYKGAAERVTWSGSFNGWRTPGLEGTRVGQTDLWLGYTELPEASRIEYKIVLNKDEWLVDPVNPHTTFSGLTGANNVVTLPGFTVTDESHKRKDIPGGALTGDLSINSQALGYTVNYRVYTPVGYESLEKLPVIYVLDGNDFVDERMGVLPNVLDTMIADGRIEPVLAVFIDAREPGNPQNNRREDEFLVHPIEHARFVADELVPVIDCSFRTDARPDARVIMGVSYGGLSAYYIAAARSDIFHELAAFSPSLWVLDSPQYVTDLEQLEGSKQMLPAFSESATQCGGDTGFRCPRLPVQIFLTTGWPDWDVGDFHRLVADLEREAYPIEFHQVREGHTWDNWRGLSDEMLIYFFSPE